MGRPLALGSEFYTGFNTLSATEVDSNALSLIIDAPTEGEEIFLTKLAVKAGHTGDAGAAKFMTVDGALVWEEGLPAQDTWGNITFLEGGLAFGVGKAAKIEIANTELSTCTLWAQYRKF